MQDIVYYILVLVLIVIWWAIYARGTKSKKEKDEHEENSI
jgi:hypothetical protein